MDDLLEPLAIYAGGQLQARTWESPEMFARTIALLEGMMPLPEAFNGTHSVEIYTQLDLCIDTAAELAA